MNMKNRQIKRLIPIMMIMIAIVFLITAFSLNKVYSMVTIEAGTKNLEVAQFLKDEQSSGEFLTDLSTIDMSVPGTYKIEIKIGNKAYGSKLQIEDTIPPTATSMDRELPLGGTIEAIDFLRNIVDATEVRASFAKEPDFSKIGEQKVSLLLKDVSNNTTELTAMLYISKVHKLVTVEAGTMKLDVASFLMSTETKGSFVTNTATLDLNNLGLQNIIVEVDGEHYTSQINVVDTVAPKADVVNQEIWAQEEIEPKEFLKDIVDETEVKVSFVKEPDFTAIGAQDISIVLQDEARNTTEVEATLTIKEDTQPPEINGAYDQTVYIGDRVSYKKDITLSDNRDNDVELIVDSSAVNLKKEGSYHVIYTAIDSSGNTTTKTVIYKVAQKPRDYVEKTDLDALADQVLASIIKENMTQKEKAKAIYTWIRSHIGYVNDSDKSDWVKAAYQGIKKGRGDCFVYYATAQELLTRAGIKNQPIIKIDETHYWNLVDCGNGWYHFDTTPRKGGSDFFMLTDAQIEEYSKKHGNSHVWDKSKYPSTPLE